jgi:hypothetical protein
VSSWMSASSRTRTSRQPAVDALRQLPHRHLRPGADIEDLPWLGALRDGHQAPDRVGDVDEVAGFAPSVADDLDGPTVQVPP